MVISNSGFVTIKWLNNDFTVNVPFTLACFPLQLLTELLLHLNTMMMNSTSGNQTPTSSVSARIHVETHSDVEHR